MIGLYVHVPFCKKRCHYCDFVLTTDDSPDLRRRFLEAIEKEAARHAPRFTGETFDTLYLGGGTPSALGDGDTERLFEILRAHFRFRRDAEVTCEANPGDVGGGRAALYRRLGVNRVSLGAQSFDDGILKRLNRSHGAADIRASFEALRQAGFDNVSVDLMLGLPGQSLGDAAASLESVLGLSPEHVSVYELTVEERTVFGKWRSQNRLLLPPEEESLGMLELAARMLSQGGYRRYELLNYARPGKESRHNLLYWNGSAYLGLGPGAHSYAGGRRFCLAKSVVAYLQKAEAGDWTPEEESSLGPGAQALEFFILSLRLAQGVDLGRFQAVLGKIEGEVAALKEKGLLEEKEGGRRLALSEKGVWFAETVFAELYAAGSVAESAVC